MGQSGASTSGAGMDKGMGQQSKGMMGSGPDMMQCHQIMEARMDMIATMLEEMLEHEKAER